MLLFAVLSAVLITSLGCEYLKLRIADEHDQIAVEEAHHIQIQSAVLSTDLRFIAYFLSFLRDQVQEHDLIDTLDPDSDPVNFEQDLLSMMHHNDLFDQIRFIDASGMERVRVDGGPNGPMIVPKQQLQYKGDKSYFRATMALSDDAVYLSRLDLNMEHGQVERPFKPVIRFGMSVTGENGKPASIIMINHKVADMLGRYRRATLPTAGISMLLNADGYWLSHPDPKQRWGFMFADRANLTMAKTAPDMWARIQYAEKGQFEYQGSMISFATVHPFAMFTLPRQPGTDRRNHLRYWKVVSQFPAAALERRIGPIRQRTLLASLLIWLLLSLLNAAVIRSRADREHVADERQRLLEQVQSLSKTLLQARDREQSEMALALHDEFGQIASAVRMRAELAGKELRAGNSAAAIRQIDGIEQATGRLIDATRKILKRLNPGHLHELGLIEAIKEMCHEWHHLSPITFTVTTHGAVIDLPEATALNLYRIAQESLTNIIRHAEATEGTISFHFYPNRLIVTIHDNGCGCDTHAHHSGLGLVGMSQRAQAMDGSLQVDSAPGHGTTITISVPLTGACRQDKENP